MGVNISEKRDTPDSNTANLKKSYSAVFKLTPKANTPLSSSCV